MNTQQSKHAAALMANTTVESSHYPMDQLDLDALATLLHTAHEHPNPRHTHQITLNALQTAYTLGRVEGRRQVHQERPLLIDDIRAIIDTAPPYQGDDP
jgi:hypothetical protein